MINFHYIYTYLCFPLDIHAARKAYKCLCLQLPTSLEFHKKMIALELVQLDILPKYVRRPYENAILQFGKDNKSIWIDYIKYEMKHGDPKRTSYIYERAIRTLDRNLNYSFLAEYSKIMTKPDSIK